MCDENLLAGMKMFRETLTFRETSRKIIFMFPLGYSVGPKYEFVLIDKGIVERVAVTFSGHRQ